MGKPIRVFGDFSRHLYQACTSLRIVRDRYWALIENEDEKAITELLDQLDSLWEVWGDQIRRDVDAELMDLGMDPADFELPDD